MVESVPENISFPSEEERILKYWKDNNVFKTSLQLSKGKPRYSFYDGPPFATGLPHYGHILAGTIKDIVTRYAHQNGYHVERRFGWDTHGLPVEYEIDKKLGIKTPEDVEKLGIAAYNDECRKIVTLYAKEWEEIIGRLGRWIDFENDYKTMYPWFMESVWWVFKQLFNKGMVYRGFKVMPFSTACNTPLSNFESGQNYKEVNDPAVIVTFPLVEDPSVSLLAWTTTPWTLPSNLALCVNPEKEYNMIQDKSKKEKYILMAARLPYVYKSEDLYVVLDRFPGSHLNGKCYKPLFPYFIERQKDGAFRVSTDSYVTEESGTGVVHQAPYFGEDDFRVCMQAGVIKKDGDIVCPVDESGRFTSPVSDYLGQYVKDADKNIVKDLKSFGRLFNLSTCKHSYPFCWRSDTPLIYKAVPSWFIRVEPIIDKLLDSNQQTTWVPSFVKEKRFANWLTDAHDWAVSRNRYWGTPIPIWMSEDGEEIVVVGSLDELHKLSGVKLEDLHREFVDNVTIPSTREHLPPLKRVTEVFDCWFESGSMPYAQAHYPFENPKEFENCFPADFIAEGVDQTRGWFYTLIVLSTCLFGKPAFKNLIVNGLVLAEDGQKMSKRKKNYPDPIEIVNKYGADALRLYLINSPVVRAETLKFKEEGVRDVLKDVFLPWYNAYRFLMQNIQMFNKEGRFVYHSQMEVPSNVMDCWILSYTQSLLEFVIFEMKAYRLYTVVPRLVKFVDNLTNWYVRMNRKRLKGDLGRDDCKQSLETLFTVLLTMIRMMSPFTPFLTEYMYQNMRKVLRESDNSIHYLMFPAVSKHLINPDIERIVERMQKVIDLGRIIRDRNTLPVKYPLPSVVIIHEDIKYLEDVQTLEHYIKDELNIKAVLVSQDKSNYGFDYRAEPDHKSLGARLKKDFKKVSDSIKKLTDTDISTFLSKKTICVDGYELGSEDIRVMYSKSDCLSDELAKIADRYEAHSEGDLLLLLDVTPSQDMIDEGVAREVINRIQKMKKNAKLVPSDEVTLHYSDNCSELCRIINVHKAYIETTVRSPLSLVDSGHIFSTFVSQETHDLKAGSIKLTITKGIANHGSLCKPAVRYINLMYVNKMSEILYGTLLLENPRGERFISMSQLVREIEIIFNIYRQKFSLLTSINPVKKLVGKDLSVDNVNLVYVIADCMLSRCQQLSPPDFSGPYSKVVNCNFRGKKGSICLHNPSGSKNIDTEQMFLKLVQAIYDLDDAKSIRLEINGKKVKTLVPDAVKDEVDIIY